MPRDPTQLLTTNRPLEAYNLSKKWLILASCIAGPVTTVINAPFGRFLPNASNPASLSPIPFFNSNALMVDGIKAWIFMELIAPITFIYGFFKSPLTFYRAPLPELFSPQTLLTTLFLVHYLNRAILGPLRSPPRSKTHIVVTLVGVAFNLGNGYTMGSYLTSPFGRIYLGGSYIFERPTFWIGVALWAIGFVGNVVHDEILFNIRRRANERREKDKEDDKKDKNAKSSSNGTTSNSKKEDKEMHYGIPQGLLYKYISYPNYLCEWLEWFGFALAAAPPPLALSFESPSAFASSLVSELAPLASPATWVELYNTPAYAFAPNAAPPWIFVLNEVLLMFPRAVRGHLWYKTRFGESYPKGRKAVIPFVL